MTKLLLFLLLLLHPLSALGMPCHYFTDKTYDPSQTAAAPYFLATAQNAFFATVAGMDKKKVVFAKQKPYATAEGLWIAHAIARQCASDAVALQKARKRHGSWEETLAAQQIDPATLEPGFAALLKRRASDGELARFVVDEALTARGVARTEEIAAVRALGGSDPETILAALLSLGTGRPAMTILQAIRAGEESWGTLLLQAGIDGNNMVDEIRRLLRRPSP